MLNNLVGQQIADYTILERIGRGGMAVVYRAHQQSVKRDVALKVISLYEATLHEHFQERFTQEAELIAALEHIHILPIYDYGIQGDFAYLAMRYLRGGSLYNLLKSGALPLDRAADIFEQIARGLAYAHSRGIIHRDLKPSNILFDDAGNAYLTDFGLAKITTSRLELTSPESIVGTPAYMSPEQLRGDKVDHRSDIYSLGVMLYNMVTGRLPFEATSSDIVSIIYQHLEKLPPPPREINPNIPPQVEGVILRALQKDPKARFDSAIQMADAFNLALGKRGSSADLPGLNQLPTIRTPRPQIKKSYVLPVAAIIFITALVAIFWLLNPRKAEDSESDLPAHATVLAGEAGTAADIVPDEAVISRAQQNLGDGFIAYITCNQTSEYHATQAREMGDFARNYGLEYRVYDSNTDEYLQITLIERARADGAEALIVCPLDTSLLEAPLTSVQEARLPLVFMGSNTNAYGGVRIEGDEYAMGYQPGLLAGEIIAAEMDGEARVIILDYPDLPYLITRADGLEAGVLENAPEAEILGRYLGGTREFAYESVNNLLAEGVEFEIIVSINDAGSFGAITALEEAGISPDEVIITSVDAEALAREYISDEYYIRGSVDVGRENFSRAAIDAVVNLLAHDSLPEIIRVPPGEVITRENLAAQSDG